MIVAWGARLVDLDNLPALRPYDLAAALAQINRWGGRMLVPYSVARHSIDCARLAREAGEPRWVQYECLMHDATEALVGDLPSPIKAHMPGYIDLEARVRAQLAHVYALEPVEPDAVRAYDLAAREREHAYLRGSPREEPWRESRDRWYAWYLRLAPAGVPR